MVQAYYRLPGEIYKYPGLISYYIDRVKEHTTGASVNECVNDFKMIEIRRVPLGSSITPSCYPFIYSFKFLEWQILKWRSCFFTVDSAVVMEQFLTGWQNAQECKLCAGWLQGLRLPP